MQPSRHVKVQIDLPRIRQNASDIRSRCGVPVIAVIKADAYGLGAAAVARAVRDLVDAFYLFDLAEVAEAQIYAITRKLSLVLHGETQNPADYFSLGARPVVWDADRAAMLRPASPVLAVDTGQQRFGCDPAEVDAILRAGDCREAMTHAIQIEQVRQFEQAVVGRDLHIHAAGSALLNDPSARLNAVRPGRALYDGAVRVSTHLIDARPTYGKAGYTGFTSTHHGIIIAGYSNGIRPGICMVNGQRRQLIEVGMQSAFVELGEKDRVGDEVVLLGDGLPIEAVAAAWNVTPQEATVRLCASGQRSYSH